MDLKPRSVLWAAIALLALGFAIYQIRSFFSPETKNGHLPADFPHAFLSPTDDGNPDAVKIWRGRTPPETLDQDGVHCWPAKVCRNENCPGKHGDQSYIFAYGWDPEAHPGPSTVCAKCAAAKRDPMQLEMYYTPEAQAMLVKVRASLGIQ